MCMYIYIYRERESICNYLYVCTNERTSLALKSALYVIYVYVWHLRFGTQRSWGSLESSSLPRADLKGSGIAWNFMAWLESATFFLDF